MASPNPPGRRPFSSSLTRRKRSTGPRGQPASFPLNRVIPGWTEGLQLMKEGGATTFVIPAKLGYGSRGAPPTIGPDATLVFHVELIKVG